MEAVLTNGVDRVSKKINSRKDERETYRHT